jgi:glucokinase
MEFALAVDIGGTKATVAIVDSTFAVHHRIEISTGDSKDLETTLFEAAKEVLAQYQGDLLGVGIGSAGPLDIDKGAISPVNIPGWRNFDVVSFFQNLSKNQNVVLRGDGMAVADAEFHLGAGRGSSNMLGMVVSTGVGGGLILGGQLIPGESGNASFFGHHTINHSGRLCACGRIGCVEAYASGPSMVKQAIERGWKSESNDFISLAEDARQGGALALEVIDEGAHALAVGIINVAAVNDLELIVIGGGVSHAGDVYWEPLLRHIAAELTHFSFLSGLRVKKAELLRDSGILGAALGIIKPAQ